MTMETSHTQASQDHDPASRQKAADYQTAPGESAASGMEAVRPAWPIGNRAQRPDPSDLGSMLSRMDDAARASAIGQLQRTYGNAYVQRLVAGLSGRSRPAPIIQREDGEQPPGGSQPGGAATEMAETTVPVPDEQRSRVETATQPVVQAANGEAPGGAAQPAGGEASAAPAPQAAEPPPVPAEAKIRAPVQFNFSMLPPELQIRLLDEFNFTATVTAARLQWARERLTLGLGYSYGGALTGSASYRAGGATFSSQLGYEPGAGVGSLSGGVRYGQFGASLGGTTQGGFSAGLTFGAALPPMPMDFTQSMITGEAGARNLLLAVPGLLSDPFNAPTIIGAHGEDISAVSGAASNIGRVIDLSKKDPNRVEWGFYINATRAPGAGLGVTAGAGVLFKREPGAESEADPVRQGYEQEADLVAEQVMTMPVQRPDAERDEGET
jgi:hypothetical protein